MPHRTSREYSAVLWETNKSASWFTFVTRLGLGHAETMQRLWSLDLLGFGTVAPNLNMVAHLALLLSCRAMNVGLEASDKSLSATSSVQFR